MNIIKDQSLRAFNTLGIDARADWFITYDSLEDLRLLVRDEYFQELRVLHIGSGSNLLFLTNFHGAILRSQITTIETIAQTPEGLTLRVGAGMIWDDLVAYATAQGYWGIENLSLIPGTVGAAAIQNIGAYGVEVCQHIERVHTLHRRTGEVKTFVAETCRYAYRDSIFKQSEYADYIVTHVDIRLSAEAMPVLSYADLSARINKPSPTPVEIREEIIRIRQSKLPDPEVLGNAGSFFMNPIVVRAFAEQLQKQYPQMPHYAVAQEDMVKLSAGWLIDQAGLKGYRDGNVGVYERQALVLVNHGGATGQEVASLAEYVQEQVRKQFGVELTPEVRYIS